MHPINSKVSGAINGDTLVSPTNLLLGITQTNPDFFVRTEPHDSLPLRR